MTIVNLSRLCRVVATGKVYHASVLASKFHTDSTMERNIELAIMWNVSRPRLSRLTVMACCVSICNFLL